MNINLIKRIFSSLFLLFISFYIIFKGSILFNFYIFLILIISFIEWHKMSYKNYYYIPGVIFLLLSFNSVYQIRNDYEEIGIFNFNLILIICILTDMGGYIFGKIFKGKKLTKISPNKTYSGAIGGILLSLVGVFTFFEFIEFFKINNYLSTQKLFFVGLIISIVNQLGDLTISFFKRLSNLKDTGNIIPGHGGILDRIDGMIFTFPMIYYFKIL